MAMTATPGFGLGGWRGGVNPGGTNNISTSHFIRYLQYFRDVGPAYIVTKPTSGPCELDFGISERFRRKLELGCGEAFRGGCSRHFFADTPNSIPTSNVHTPQYSTSKANPPVPRFGLQGCWRAPPTKSWHRCF